MRTPTKFRTNQSSDMKDTQIYINQVTNIVTSTVFTYK